ncbi:MAG: M48 family metallopeptidase [Halothiobacillaceae bacterium]|nr:M48 family metallopeptidase [Halothiobacillaceae bacterium]
MDFREQQDQARRQTRVLVGLYVLLVIAAAASVGALAWLGLTLGEHAQASQATGSATIPAEANWQSFAWAAGLTGGGILLVTLFRWFTRSNGAKVARSMGGRELTGEGESDLSAAERQYLNIVDEMAIAAALPRPRVFLLDREAGINAFAAGTRPENAAVAVTQGALDNLSRDELAGVVAHEFGHIANSDIKLSVRVAAMVFGFTFLFFVARWWFHVGVGPGRRDARLRIAMLVGAAAIALVGLLTVFFGRILQAAVSRQREFLADASAVQFTRHPDGLKSAFEKLKGGASSRVESDAATEMNHAFLFRAGGARLFDTHPPLEERIRRLEGYPIS